MPLWLKVTRPNVEIGTSFVLYQSVLIDMERVTGYAIQNLGSVTVFIDGKAFVIQQQLDDKAYKTVLAYCQRATGQTLP
jgi:hypothetical protein